jgi:hypothetical protein
MACKTNLLVQILSNLPMVAKLEDLLQSLEFTKLANIMEKIGLRILQNVRTWWISMLEPLKRVMAKYKTLIMKISQDNASIA